MILETKRLILREMTSADFGPLCEILQDPDVMYAYEHAFSDSEAEEWLANQIRRYRRDGFGLWAVIERQSGVFIGQCGLTLQDCGDGEICLEIGYLFQKEYWHQGFAIESARGCKKYAFETLQSDQVCSIIRINNLPSQKVALRNGMTPEKRIVKHYFNLDMPHDIYVVHRGFELQNP